MRYNLVTKSKNEKTGPIPVSMSTRDTCPAACAFRGSGCYAEQGHVAIHWRNVEKKGVSFDEFCAQVYQLPPGTLWRHNVAGDLPGRGNRIDVAKLRDLVDANEGKRGFTYTHKPMTPTNVKAVRSANRNGFTINLSANTLQQADTLRHHRLPVVVVVDSGTTENIVTPAGQTVVICPATRYDHVTCATCQLCQRSDRKVVVGFPAHGSSWKKVDLLLKAAPA